SEAEALRLIEERLEAPLGPLALEGRGPGPALGRPAPMRTLWVGGGRKDKLRPTDLLGALTGEAGGLEGAQIGKIELHDHHCFVAVAAPLAQAAAARLSRGRIKGRRFRAYLLDSPR